MMPDLGGQDGARHVAGSRITVSDGYGARNQEPLTAAAAAAAASLLQISGDVRPTSVVRPGSVALSRGSSAPPAVAAAETSPLLQPGIAGSDSAEWSRSEGGSSVPDDDIAPLGRLQPHGSSEAEAEGLRLPGSPLASWGAAGGQQGSPHAPSTFLTGGGWVQAAAGRSVLPAAAAASASCVVVEELDLSGGGLLRSLQRRAGGLTAT